MKKILDDIPTASLSRCVVEQWASRRRKKAVSKATTCAQWYEKKRPNSNSMGKTLIANLITTTFHHLRKQTSRHIKFYITILFSIISKTALLWIQRNSSFLPHFFWLQFLTVAFSTQHLRIAVPVSILRKNVRKVTLNIIIHSIALTNLVDTNIRKRRLWSEYITLILIVNPGYEYCAYVHLFRRWQ